MGRRASKEQREETYKRKQEHKKVLNIINTIKRNRKRRFKTSLKRLERVAETIEDRESRERLKQAIEVEAERQKLLEDELARQLKMETAKAELREIEERLEREEESGIIEIEFE